jgi:hypothetical protein
VISLNSGKAKRCEKGAIWSVLFLVVVPLALIVGAIAVDFGHNVNGPNGNAECR